MQGGEPTPVGEIVDEKAIVNACVALLASGGSTNHTLHLVAIARAAGHRAHLAGPRPTSRRWCRLLARIYPNGSADVNHFHAAGGIAFLVHTLLRARAAARRRADHRRPRPVALHDRAGAARRRADAGRRARSGRLDLDVLRPADDPFSADGGLKVLTGPLGHRRHQDVGGQARAPRRSPRRRSSSTTRPTS